MNTVPDSNSAASTRVALKPEEGTMSNNLSLTLPTNQLPVSLDATSASHRRDFQRYRNPCEDDRCGQREDGIVTSQHRKSFNHFHPPCVPHIPQRPASTSTPFTSPEFPEGLPLSGCSLILSPVAAPGYDSESQLLLLHKDGGAGRHAGTELTWDQNDAVEEPGMSPTDSSMYSSSSLSPFQNSPHVGLPPPQYRKWSGVRRAPHVFRPAFQATIQKTRLCLQLTGGRPCLKPNCLFAHSTTELRQRPDLFRTTLCRSYSEGRECGSGQQCHFAHGLQELRHTKEFYKTALCSLWKTNGVCKVGSRCRFAHGNHEIRFPPETRKAACERMSQTKVSEIDCSTETEIKSDNRTIGAYDAGHTHHSYTTTNKRSHDRQPSSWSTLDNEVDKERKRFTVNEHQHEEQQPNRVLQVGENVNPLHGWKGHPEWLTMAPTTDSRMMNISSSRPVTCMENKHVNMLVPASTASETLTSMTQQCSTSPTSSSPGPLSCTRAQSMDYSRHPNYRNHRSRRPEGKTTQMAPQFNPYQPHGGGYPSSYPPTSRPRAPFIRPHNQTYNHKQQQPHYHHSHHSIPSPPPYVPRFEPPLALPMTDVVVYPDQVVIHGFPYNHHPPLPLGHNARLPIMDRGDPQLHFIDAEYVNNPQHPHISSLDEQHQSLQYCRQPIPQHITLQDESPNYSFFHHPTADDNHQLIATGRSSSSHQLNFWMGPSRQITMTSGSNSPSTDSVIFNTSPSDMLTAPPIYSSTRTAHQKEETKEEAENEGMELKSQQLSSHPSADWMRHLPHLTHESVYSVQYED